jgi:hypothetical protein
MAVLLAVVLPVVIGFVVVTALWPARQRPDQAFVLKTCLAVAWGVGVAAWTFFLWLVFAGAPSPGLVLFEAAVFSLLLAGAVVVLRRQPSSLELPSRPLFAGILPLALTLIFLGVLAARAAEVVMFSQVLPHGEGDAYFIWNLKARFLYRAGEDWRLIFTFPAPDNEKIPLAPPDYPLLVPATVARLWWYSGLESTRVPALAALLVTLGSVVLLWAIVTAVRGRSQGAIAGLALGATPFYFFLGSAQVADIPLAYFMLATVGLLVLHDATGGVDRRWVVLAGMLAGLAGWTKNEGLLFIAVVTAVRLLVVPLRDGLRAAVREAGAFLLGLLPFLCLLLYYRLDLVPTVNYLLATQGDQTTLERLQDASRYRTILLMMLLQVLPINSQAHWTSIGWIVVLAVPYRLLMGRNPTQARRVALTPLLVVVLMLVGYVFIYATTPLELRGHLRSSLHRVMVALWPIGLLWFFLSTATPEEALRRNSPATPEPTAD